MFVEVRFGGFAFGVGGLERGLDLRAGAEGLDRGLVLRVVDGLDRGAVDL